MNKINYDQKTLTKNNDGNKKKRKYIMKAVGVFLKLSGWIWKLLDYL